MHGDYGYIEEGHQGSVYNFKLMRRLYPFVAPFKKSIFIILLVTVSATLLNLVLPYITKMAMDRYIVSTYRTDDDGVD